MVIDEIDLHLHSDLQYKVLPELIKLFPKVQFIITSHSPLFILGMNQCFGEEHIDIIDMPSGERITAERFSEFQNAYSFYSNTELYRDDMKRAIEKIKAGNLHQVIIITEGSTDWKHMKAALESLQKKDEYSEWLTELSKKISFLEYDSMGEAACQMEMGGDSLKAMCEQFSKIKQGNKFIFIADNDKDNVCKRLKGSKGEYKYWGNNVYSFCLDVPAFRPVETISIEHLYRDEDLKRWIECRDGIKRRIFTKDEFIKGKTYENNKGYYVINATNKNEIVIIPKNVYSVDEGDETDYALGKNLFAEYVRKQSLEKPNIDFSGFVSIFEKIEKIIKQSIE